MHARLACLAALIALLVIASCTGTKPAVEDSATASSKREDVAAQMATILPTIRPADSEPISLAAGRLQFERKCAFCHGADGMKKIPLASEEAHRVGGFAPDDIAVQIHSGVNVHGKVTNHKLFKTLKGGELYGTILYAQNFFLRGEGENPFEGWRARLDAGHALWDQHCASCHSAEPDYPREYLYTHSPQSMVEAMAAKHEPPVKDLPETDRWQIAYFIQSHLYTFEH